jgi:2-methylisocitrate lyase-like PEP mutase family enzyme
MKKQDVNEREDPRPVRKLLENRQVMPTSYEEKVSRFHKLHQAPPILVLPNAWDVCSARIFSSLGFEAIATTSAGIANCLGFRDGENIPLSEMLLMIKKIVAAVDLPVTADFEAGYTDDLTGLSQNVCSVIDAEVVGINLEDSFASGGLRDSEQQAQKIKTVRTAASSAGVDLFINARVDTYLRGVGEGNERRRDTIDRGQTYKNAGANGIFIPGVTDEREIETLAREIPAPINVLATANTRSVRVLEKLGVARVSVGSGPARACATLARRIGTELIEKGSYDAFTQGVMSNKEVNSLFRDGDRSNKSG